jgi:N-acetylmuramoyl-L-alanine amidase
LNRLANGSTEEEDTWDVSRRLKTLLRSVEGLDA